MTAGEPTRVASICALGNPIVNYVCRVERPSDLPLGLTSGDMTLVGSDIWESLVAKYQIALIQPGGTSVNTISAMASQGINCTFIGCVGADSSAALFRNHFDSLSIEWINTIPNPGSRTGRCLILVTPDGERTLITDLGNASSVDARLLSGQMKGAPADLLTEVYQWDAVDAEGIFDLVQRWDRGQIVLSLSSVSAIERHRDRVLKLVRSQAITLVGSREEFRVLTGADHPAVIEATMEMLKSAATSSNAFVTLGRAGSAHCGPHGNELRRTDPNSSPVDLTGAGDLFLAGVLVAKQVGETDGGQLAAGNRFAGRIIRELGSQLGWPSEE